ncbi:MAG TPA: ABC transporter substrate-binding protein, partial [Clostridia bacterium]|nr:ABC transporter substrate-binding protein [Clostridia bacterium]
MKRTMVFLFAALFLVATLTSACTSAPKEAEPIKIGIFEPLTGANAAGGQMELEGIKVAHSIKGEVLGRKIVLVEMDNKSDDVEAVTAAERLVNEEKVAVVVGSWGSSVCIAAGPTFEAAKIPAIGTSCTNPLVTLDNDYYFRVCYLDDFQGTLLANFAKQNGYMKAGVIVDVSDTYAIGLRNFFVEAYGKDNIVAEAKFNKGDQDFTAQITTVMAAKPDVIFAPSGYTEAGL